MPKKTEHHAGYKIALSCSHPQAGDCNTAISLAASLNLPLTASNSQEYTMLLVHTGSRLELRQTGQQAPGPVWADFTSPAIRYRMLHGGGLRQLLARAAGLKPGYRPTVLDATAGLGRDAFILASLGCRVTMFERVPVIAALLEDGLRRALHHPDIGEIVKQRIEYIAGDSLLMMKQLGPNRQPDTIYLDPMYPLRTKSAKVKKEMRLLRSVVGDDSDAPALLAAALVTARNRIVVKRPKLAPRLPGLEPSLVLRGSNSRYDIYLAGSF
jgi:16S rRNA (guanine1516-N2)-methyltransferase